MNIFFRLIHNDMGGICLERLNEMRAPGKVEQWMVNSEFNVSLFHFVYDVKYLSINNGKLLSIIHILLLSVSYFIFFYDDAQI